MALMRNNILNNELSRSLSAKDCLSSLSCSRQHVICIFWVSQEFFFVTRLHISILHVKSGPKVYTPLINPKILVSDAKHMHSTL